MLTIPAGFITAPVTDLQVCWLVVKRDGTEIRGTEYDRDITITTGTWAGTYLAHAGITGSDVRSTSDLSVDNLEVTGALAEPTGESPIDSSSLFLLDVNAADIKAGLLDNAEAATFIVNSTDPDLYQRMLRNGWIGNTTRTAEGQYKTEMRGLTQALSQGIVRTYGVGCDAELGDERCTVDMTPFTTTFGVVETEHSTDPRRKFFHADDAFPLESLGGLIVGGTITFTSGLNEGFSMEIKEYDAPNDLVTLYLPMPNDIEPPDTFTFRAGCDKKRDTCHDVYDNLLNFRGHGYQVPGEFEILKVGKR